MEVAWPDNFPRSIERVLYEVDGSVVANLSPDEAFTWDFSQLPAGIHSLRAVVRDELGLEGRSDPVRAEINIMIPPPPPPTVTPEPTPTAEAALAGANRRQRPRAADAADHLPASRNPYKLMRP